jgi:hypothetical protein
MQSRRSLEGSRETYESFRQGSHCPSRDSKGDSAEGNFQMFVYIPTLRIRPKVETYDAPADVRLSLSRNGVPARTDAVCRK